MTEQMNLTIEDLIGNIDELVAFPEVYHRLDQLIRAGDYTAEQVASLISQDPSLTVKLLRVANSSYYGLSREVESVSRAITILGAERVRDLVLSTSASKILAGIPNDLFVVEDFWHHSIACGVMADDLAKISPATDNSFAFVAGLLHDIGQLAYFNVMPGMARVVLELLMDSSQNLGTYEAERRVLGFDHMALGAALLRSWNLPERIQACAGHHHDPGEAKEYPVEASIIHIANWLTYVIEVDMPLEVVVEKIDPIAWQQSKLQPEIVATTIENARSSIDEVRSSLGLN